MAHLCHCDEKTGGCGCLILLAIIGLCWMAQNSNKPVPRYVAPKEESKVTLAKVLSAGTLALLGTGGVVWFLYRKANKKTEPEVQQKPFAFRDPPVKLTPQQVTEAARKSWDIMQLAHSLPCFGCRGAAEPVPGTENMYVCKKCGRHFTNRRHNQQERP